MFCEEMSDKKLIGLEIVEIIFEKVRVIKDQMKVT